MSDNTKRRGLGRGLDALFGDVKKDDQSSKTPGQTSAAAQAPTSRRAEESHAPIKRADEMLAASQALKTPASSATKAADANIETKSIPNNGGTRKVAVDKLIPGKFQPRHHFDDNALQQLAESIEAHGVLQPLLVRPRSNGDFEIIAGERRWRAAQLAKLHELPVVVQDLNDKQALEIALIENLQREDLSAVEEAEGYQRLMNEFGHTQEVIATQLGKSRSHVANTLRLLKLPNSVRQMVLKGDLSAGHARALVGAKNPDELADIISRRNLSVRQTEQLVQKSAEGKLRPPKKSKSFVQKDVDILALEQKLTSTLGLKIQIEGTGSAGKLVIEYKKLDQLDDVIKRLTRK
jgi:ParB family chromosome partitioning protein